jgi:hypothetical protein
MSSFWRRCNCGHHQGPDGAFLRAAGAFDRCHKKTLDLNQIDNVALHHVVAGAKSGKAYLKRANAKTQEWRSFDRAWVTGQLMMLLVMSM